ncbi:uncharacterized protein FIBRA_07492 [Fibroporia radiculosa]|uniref:C2H2-type domain-containing protein n=1 Tax=Fibroporia radiculosa TaxID=599839 RepID=J4GV30_9APHY|nr:uncharacterized protein FIBRA_07492 [Fibroporia radiculosa]CCM05280.1 predicted protein [Fibroporia radiculosa]
MSRERINRLAVQYDTTNVITNPSRLIEGSGGYTLPERTVTTWATERSFNGTKYECFLCHREYRTLAALNQHLGSAAHDDDIYRCPRGWQGCGTEFRTLSGLCQHVEAERCGIRRFNDPMQSVITSMSSALRGLIL